MCQQRRLTLFGHTCRLPSDAPSRQALEEAIRPVKKLVGGQKKTLIGLIEEDLKTIQTTLREAMNIAQDKKDFQCLVQYEKTHLQPSSETVKFKRLKGLGHFQKTLQLPLHSGKLSEK